MEFEFAPHKSQTNHAKHGIHFVHAQQLWQDSARVAIPARTVDEPRSLVTGRIDSRHWSAIVTTRQNNLRIISVRHSRAEEVAIHEG